MSSLPIQLTGNQQWLPLLVYITYFTQQWAVCIDINEHGKTAGLNLFVNIQRWE